MYLFTPSSSGVLLRIKTKKKNNELTVLSVKLLVMIRFFFVCTPIHFSRESSSYVHFCGLITIIFILITLSELYDLMFPLNYFVVTFNPRFANKFHEFTSTPFSFVCRVYLFLFLLPMLFSRLYSDLNTIPLVVWWEKLSLYLYYLHARSVVMTL
jgi:hypothetical protein